MIDDEEADFGYQHKIAQTLGNAFLGYKYSVQYLWHQLLGKTFENSVVRNIHEATNWNSFDKYFDKIQSEIINPLEKSTGAVSGYDNFICFSTPCGLATGFTSSPPTGSTPCGVERSLL